MESTLAAPAPTTTAPPQYQRALAEANRIRYARASVKRRIFAHPDKHSSVVECAKVLADPPPELHSMPTMDLLLACRRVGQMKTRRLLNAAVISEGRPIGRLTTAQRQRLVAALGILARPA